MLASNVMEALRFLGEHLQAISISPVARAMLGAFWRGESSLANAFEPDVRTNAELVDRALPALTRSNAGTATLISLLDDALVGPVVLAWCEGAVGRGDVRLLPILSAAAKKPDVEDRVPEIARGRVLEGPLSDALPCALFCGDARTLFDEEHTEVRARLEILFWEAGGCAVSMPEMGALLWGDPEMFRLLVAVPARGTLRGRVLAARILEVCAAGIPPALDPEEVGFTLQTLHPLLLHPEPLVWIHASRAVGRLAGVLDALEGTLLDWLRGSSPLLRQRAVTAFASLPAERLRVLSGELSRVLDDSDAESWLLAGGAAATPYLLFERREQWDRLSARILAGDGGATAARGLAKGLAALWRRGLRTASVENPMRALREKARRARTDSVDEWRRWLDVLSETDVLDGAERDPLDLERGLENLVRLAAQFDDEEADARARRFALALEGTFQEARREVFKELRPRRRAAAINALEGVARALALSLWTPLLRTRPAGTPIPEPDLSEAWGTIFHAPADLLEQAEELAKENQELDPEAKRALLVAALRVAGYALDACDDEDDTTPNRGPTAYRLCLWLSRQQELTDTTKELSTEVRWALSALCWRLVDIARGEAPAHFDDALWLGPFVAWWALVIDRPAVLRQVSRSMPMVEPAMFEALCVQGDTMRAAVAPDAPQAIEGGWWGVVEKALHTLRAEETELFHALEAFAAALYNFSKTSGPKPDLEAQCRALALSCERLVTALEDPPRALRETVGDEGFVSDGAPRVGALLAQAIRARDAAPLSVWIEALGSLVRGLVESAIAAAIRRTPPPPPSAKQAEPATVEGYQLVRPLGEGGIGSVWLTKKQGGDRYFVLKIPKADALLGASETERAEILRSFEEEAKALASLYHPNVASIIDRGHYKGVPFLVLEYLIGADLRAYSQARFMTVAELRPVVQEACAGLAALHAAGLVHRDIKPANIWLRLPMQGGETFDANKHRDPVKVPVLATVVIDMGMVRAFRVAQEAMGRFVAGTPGYLAPEQIHDPMDLDGRADVYSLAGTVYNTMTGKTFFDELTSPRARIAAHLTREPLEDPELVRTLPANLVKLLRAATERDPKNRPKPLEFAREFALL